MVIQCSSCDTRFKLADDKLKPGGVKVRCSKCKEVFTVMPPEEGSGDSPAAEMPFSGSAANDWSDLNGDDSGRTESEETGGIDWSNIGTDEEESPGDDFSFGGEVGSDSGEISFDDSESATDGGISFDEPAGGETDSISFEDTSGGVNKDDFGFDESVGEGAQDEFSFDDSGSSLGVTDDTPDFDWDGSGQGDEPDDFDFGDSDSGAEGGLDFSSVALEERDEPPPQPPMPEPTPSAEETQKPLSAKGPQKAKGKQRVRKPRKAKKRGSLRGLVFLFFFLLLLAAGHAGILYWKGLWAGDPAELVNLDHETVHLQVYRDIFAEITGEKVAKEPEGQVAVLNMSGQFVENSAAGTLFVIEGRVKNEFREPRSAIAVRGILYDPSGKPVMRKKVYCGNRLNEQELRTLSLDQINERLANQFGDSLSNLDVAPNVDLPFTIVFANLPANLAEFNVEVAESTPGSK